MPGLLWFGGLWDYRQLPWRLFSKRFAANNESLQFQVVALMFALNVGVNVFPYLPHSKYLALAGVGITALLTTFGNGPVFSGIQSIVNENMRSVTIALLFMFSNLIGFGLGPLFLGLISDFMHPAYGTDSLRYALAMFSPGAFWVAYYYWRSSKTIAADIKISEAGKGVISERVEEYYSNDVI